MLLSVFIIGFCCGVISLTIGLTLYVKRLDRKSETDTKKLLDDIEMMGSIKYRFSKVNEITEQQLDLISRAERPSASAAHSKSKNDVINQIKALEEEKIEIFRSILKDGMDPNLSIIVDGQPQQIKMSEAVAMHEGTSSYDAIKPTPKTEPKTPRNNGLRLVTPTDEGSNESEDPTFS